MNNFYSFTNHLQSYEHKIYKCDCHIHKCQTRICQLRTRATNLQISMMKLNEENRMLRSLVNQRKNLQLEYQIELLNEKQCIKKLYDLEKNEKKNMGVEKKKIKIESNKNNENKQLIQSQLVKFTSKLKEAFDQQSEIMVKWEKIQKYLSGMWKLNLQNSIDLTLNDSKRTIVDALKCEESRNKSTSNSRTLKKKFDPNIMDKLLIRQL